MARAGRKSPFSLSSPRVGVERPTLEDLEERIKALEERKITLDDLPLSQVKRKLDLDHPIADDLLLPHSIGRQAMRSEVFDHPGVWVSRDNSTQTFANTVWTAMSFDVEYQESSLWNISNPTRIQIPVIGYGWYVISAKLDLPSGTDVTVAFDVRKNAGGLIGGGTSVVGIEVAQGSQASNLNQIQFADIVEIQQTADSLSDYIEVFAKQTSGLVAPVNATIVQVKLFSLGTLNNTWEGNLT